MAEVEIKSNRLVLKPFSEKYITPDYVGWLNNRKLMRYSEQRHRTHLVSSCQTYLKSFEGSDSYFWAIVEKEKNIHIGNITAYIDRNNNLANISLLIGNDLFRGKGYGQEGWDAVINWLKNDLKIRKIMAGTMELNKPMLKIMQRSGMKQDGIFERHYLHDEDPVNIIFMSIFSESRKSSDGDNKNL